MAQTVKVEIPITATDNTAAGVGSAQRRMDQLERSMQKMQRQMDRMTKGRHDVNLDAKDNASRKIADVDDAVNKTGGKEANVEVTAHDAATGVLNSVEGTTEELNGEEAVIDMEAEDAASGVIQEVSDQLGELHGEEAVTEVSAEDAASGTISDIGFKLSELNGDTATVIIQAEDAATGALGQAADSARMPIAETAGVMGASFGVYESISTFAGFEQAMAQVQAISGATGKELEALTEKAEYMGATTKFTATESAEAMNYMAMAGWKTDEMLSGLPGIMNLAAAAGESLGTTSDIVTDALTAFGMSASDSTHFADVMAQASANANTNVAMLGESFKYVAPVAGAMKYSIEDTALALGLMANAGVKSSMSGTALRRAITALASPTDKQATAFEKYGISLKDSEGNQKSLNDVMQNLRTNLGGLAEDEKTAAVSAMFGNQALAGMLAIINASEQDFNKLSEAVNNADGASQDMADTMIDTMQGSFTLMQSAIEGVEDSFGKRLSPYMRSLADGIAESMPDATKALNGLMDTIDVKAGHIKKAWKNMVSTDEWKESGLGGKINMAFETMIGKPISKWFGGDGKNMISSAVGGLFSDAFKILPGGEKAGLTSWLSAGVLAKGAMTGLPVAAKGIGFLTKSLSGFFPAASVAIPAAAAVAAALGAITIAAHNYQQQMAQASLDEHFGDVSLTDAQAKDVAENILNAKMGVNLELALDRINGADELRKSAEEALQDNDALEFKNSVGIKLTADDQTEYQENIDAFIENSLSELENRTYSASVMVNTVLTTPEGEKLSNAINNWTLGDTIEMNSLSTQLREAVTNAISDGIIGVDEQQHINELQMKMTGILNKWRESESEAAFDLITQKYGSLSGHDLDAKSFQKVIDELQTQREENSKTLDESSKDFYTMLNAMEKSGRLKEIGLTKDQMAKQWSEAIRNEEASQMARSIDFERNTLQGTYGKEINTGSGEVRQNVRSTMEGLSRTVGNEDLFNDQISFANDAAKNVDSGLAKIYDAMKPDTEAYAGLIDEYRKAGQAVPKDIMDSFNSAMEMGAAAGDRDAGLNVLAKSIAEEGNQDVIDQILNNNDKGSATYSLKEALERQLGDISDEPVTMDGVTAKLTDPNVVTDDADAVHDKIGDVMKSISESGSASSYDSSVDGLTITLGEVEVDGQSAAQQVADALGMTLDELAETTGTTTKELEAGATITIPADKITTDKDQLKQSVDEATQQAVDETEGEEKTITTNANVEVEAGSTDTSGLDSGIQEAVDGADNPKTTVAADATVDAGNVDTSGVANEAQSATQSAFDNAVTANGKVDVNLAKGSDNVSSVYDQVGNAIKDKFSSGYNASANLNVSIHVNYSIANPSKTVTFSGAGSGSGTITAHAYGGFVDSAEFSLIGEDGPEFVIPVGSKRKRRGAELWAKAGEALGMFDSIPAYADGGAVGMDEDSLSVTPFEANKQNEQDELSQLLGSDSSGSSSALPGSIPSATGDIGKQANENNSGVEVNIDMSPVIRIDGSSLDEESVFEVMKERIKELADDVSEEVGEKLTKLFSNMPIGMEAM